MTEDFLTGDNLPNGRISISTYGGPNQRRPVMGGWETVNTVRHWSLHFDGEFLADTSAPHHVRKWLELAEIVNG